MMFEGDSETIVGDAANGRGGVQPIETKDVQQEETTRREHQEEAATKGECSESDDTDNTQQEGKTENEQPVIGVAPVENCVPLSEDGHTTRGYGGKETSR